MGRATSRPRLLLAAVLTAGALFAAVAAPGGRLRRQVRRLPSQRPRHALLPAQLRRVHDPAAGQQPQSPGLPQGRRRGPAGDLAASRSTYRILDNTRSANKTDFWTYASSYGFPGLKANVGITGHKLTGTPEARPGHAVLGGHCDPDHALHRRPELRSPAGARGSPCAAPRPTRSSRCNPRSWYPSRTRCVATCCHGPVDTAGSILQAHDAGQRDAPVRRSAGRHAARLQRVPQGQRPGRPRAARRDAALAGHPRRPPRQDGRCRAVAAFGTPCYTCHPGAQTQCLRGRMAQAGFTCTERGLPRRHGAGGGQPGGADRPAGLAAGAHVRRLPRRQIRGEPRARSIAIRTPDERPRRHERQAHPVRVLPWQPARRVAVHQDRSTTRCRCSCRVWRRSSSAASACHGDASGRIHGAQAELTLRPEETRRMDYEITEKDVDPAARADVPPAGDDGRRSRRHRRRVRRAHGARRQDRRPVGRTAVRPVSGCLRAASSRSPSACRSRPAPTGGEQVASRRCRAGRWRPRCTWGRTTRSARPTRRCRSG